MCHEKICTVSAEVRFLICSGGRWPANSAAVVIRAAVRLSLFNFNHKFVITLGGHFGVGVLTC